MSVLRPDAPGVAVEGDAPLTVTIPLAAIAWVLAGALFAAIRLWPIWGTPVGGAELVHLSGAWQAHAGVEDSRYVPTLFQAIVAGLFSMTTSEAPARLLAFTATATVPAALYCLRHDLGDLGALAALVLLTFDAPSLALGAESGAMGFDVALAAWLFVFAVRKTLPAWAGAIAAFLLATGGPLPLPLVAAITSRSFLRRDRLDARALAWPAGGAIAGILLTTERPGLGPDGLTIAPLTLFGASFEETWSTADVLALTLMTSWSTILLGTAAAAWLLASRRALGHTEQLLLLWGAFASGWLLTSLPSHSVVPLAGLTLPAAMLAGPALVALAQSLREADWTLAKYLVPASAAALAVIAFYVGDWAKFDHVGGNGDKAIVFGLSLAVLAVIGALGADRCTLPTLAALALPVAAVPLLIATSAVAFRSGDSPIPSPYARDSARDLRDIALDAASRGGSITIHRDFAEELTWPFRDSGNVVVTSQPPADAAIIIWPAAGPAALEAPPAGFAVIDGEWALVARVEPPTRFLKLVRWYSDRYSLANGDEPVTVFIRESE